MAPVTGTSTADLAECQIDVAYKFDGLKFFEFIEETDEVIRAAEA
jgi:hypothetical protein